MLEHNKNKVRTEGVFLPEARDQVKITFETNTRENKINNLTSVTVTNNDHIQLKKKRLNKISLHSHVHRHIPGVNTRKKNGKKKLKHKKNHLKPRKYHHLHRNDRKNLTMVRQKRNAQQYDIVNDNEDAGDRKKKLEFLARQLNLPGDNAGAEEKDFIANVILTRQQKRIKRNQEPVKPPALLDQGIKHGGNALRNHTANEDSSVSSFEEELFTCYEGNVLVAQEFDPDDLCTNVTYLDSGKSMQSRHNVIEDGYYYYIFYSDNDLVSNDIHAIFDIYKPTFQYENITKSCINDTECTFPLSIMSSDRVIVEVPTKDGIDESDDISLLISVCHPRMGMYIIFPIAVLFLILSCAFL